MISGAGICIVLAGNRLNSVGMPTLADGVREEVEIAQGQGCIVVPIGATAYVARELWEQFRKDLKKYYGEADVGKEFEILGDSSSEVPELVRSTIDILRKICS